MAPAAGRACRRRGADRGTGAPSGPVRRRRRLKRTTVQAVHAASRVPVEPQQGGRYRRVGTGRIPRSEVPRSVMARRAPKARAHHDQARRRGSESPLPRETVAALGARLSAGGADPEWIVLFGTPSAAYRETVTARYALVARPEVFHCPTRRPEINLHAFAPLPAGDLPVAPLAHTAHRALPGCRHTGSEVRVRRRTRVRSRGAGSLLGVGAGCRRGARANPKFQRHILVSIYYIITYLLNRCKSYPCNIPVSLALYSPIYLTNNY